jgi:hypothetical protein
MMSVLKYEGSISQDLNTKQHNVTFIVHGFNTKQEADEFGEFLTKAFEQKVKSIGGQALRHGKLFAA